MKLTDPDTLIITDYRNGLMKLSISSATITPWLTRRNSESFRGVNDLTPTAAAISILPIRARPGCTMPADASSAQPEWPADLLLDNCPSPNGRAVAG